jgi:hypothetical protein
MAPRHVVRRVVGTGWSFVVLLLLGLMSLPLLYAGIDVLLHQ